MVKNTFKTILIIYLLLFSVNIFSQNKSSLEISNIKFVKDSCYVDIYFSIRDDDGNKADAFKVEGKFDIQETRGSDETSRRVDTIIKLIDCKNQVQDQGSGSPIESDEFEQEDIIIAVALDWSGSMDNNELEIAKASIMPILDLGLPSNSVWFYTFHDEIKLHTNNLTKSNHRNFFDPITKTDKDTDLRGCISTIVNNLMSDGKDCKKVLIIISDGKHDKHPEAPKEKDIFNLLEGKPNLLIIPIGVGNGIDEPFLKELPKHTESNLDEYKYAENFDGIKEIIKQIPLDVFSDYIFRVKSAFKTYSGLERIICISLSGASTIHIDGTVQDCLEYSAGSGTNSIDCSKGVPVDSKNLLSVAILIGLGILTLLFVVAAVLFPKFKEAVFKKKYVLKYKDHIKRASLDPEMIQDCGWCGEEIKPNENVVTKCNHVQHYACWKDKEIAGNKCFNHPQMCKKGVQKIYTATDFFQQKGETMHLNWMLFGAIGTFIAWILITLIFGMETNKYADFITNLLSNFFGKGLDERLQAELIERKYFDLFYMNTLVGTIIGAILSTIFSYLEAKQKRINIMAILKILLRGIIGAVGGFMAFLIGSFFHSLINTDYISQFVSWLTFSLLLGIILSIGTSIKLKDSILGGLLATVVGFQFLFFIQLLPINNTFGQLFAYIIFGAIIGTTISVVVEKMEKFSLEIITSDFKRKEGHKIRIHKWMTGVSKQNVYIGKGKDNHIELDWEDNVADRVAQLANEDGVYLTALEDENNPENQVKLNGRLLQQNKQRKVQNGDIIIIGGTSLKYFEEDK